MAKLLILSFFGVSMLTGGYVILAQSGEAFSLSLPADEPMAIFTYIVRGGSDIENQKPLANPPSVIKGIYATAWTAGTSGLDRLIDLIKKTELNAVVIDIKDYSGVISYDIQVPDVIKYKAKEIRTARINSIIKRLHDAGIYVIARQTIFQDPALAKARPDLAVKNIETGEPWTDRLGISWADPASQEVWDYNIAIAEDALDRGFDEVNFDYIRFPSDGDLSLLSYDFYDPKTTYKKDVIRAFFKYLRAALPDAKISADLFGYTAINKDDLGIGQIIEYGYESFNAVAPMVYPSHFNTNFLGYKNPATNPYEVIEYSMKTALQKLKAHNEALGENAPTTSSKLRPWLQDFSIGGVKYDADKVRQQIDAFDMIFCKLGGVEVPEGESCDAASVDGWGEFYDGWMLWSSSNRYTAEALKTE